MVAGNVGNLMPHIIPTVAEYAAMSNRARANLMTKLGVAWRAPEPAPIQAMTHTHRLANHWLEIYGTDPDAAEHMAELAKVARRG